ncbi:Hypothetical predicted protein, partial [Olea europaea subsp. europaea]
RSSPATYLHRQAAVCPSRNRIRDKSKFPLHFPLVGLLATWLCFTFLLILWWRELLSGFWGGGCLSWNFVVGGGDYSVSAGGGGLFGNFIVGGGNHGVVEVDIMDLKICWMQLLVQTLLMQLVVVEWCKQRCWRWWYNSYGSFGSGVCHHGGVVLVLLAIVV